MCIHELTEEKFYRSAGNQFNIFIYTFFKIFLNWLYIKGVYIKRVKL